MDKNEGTREAIESVTAAGCWLCDRERGELGHVHAPADPNDREPPATALSVPKGNE